MNTEDKVSNEVNETTDSLEVVDPLEDIIAEERSEAIFECEVEGSPQPACTWFKNGKIIKQSRKFKISNNKKWHRLEVTKVEQEDHGVYTIVCKNNTSQISCKAVLYVAPKQKNDVLYTNLSPDLDSRLLEEECDVVRHLSDVNVSVEDRIELKVEFKPKAITDCLWYKNNELIKHNERTKLLTSLNTSTLSIQRAESSDSGVYFVVIITMVGMSSSVAAVQVIPDVSTSNDNDLLPYIEEPLPEEIETNEREDIRLICKSIFDINTEIKWFKNNVLIEGGNFVHEDYGNNHIGLRIINPSKADTAKYSVTLCDERTGKVDSTNCFLTVNSSLLKNPPAVRLRRPLESVIACYGSQVAFNCSFELTDPTYFYVVWYVGHYRVERSNSRFSVICKGGDFVLYIRKLEPGMGGKVACELRKALPHRKSVLISSTATHVSILPWNLVEQEKNNAGYRRGKIYSGATESVQVFDAGHIGSKDLSLNGNGNGHMPCYPTELILEIDYSRLEDDGTFFLHASKVCQSHGGGVFETKTINLDVRTVASSKTVVFEWDDGILPMSVWYSIELRQTEGQYVEAGVSSQATFELQNPPVGKLLGIRIKTVAPASQLCDSTVCIMPAHEEVLKPVKTHELKPMAQFEASYSKSDDVIGCGAFGSVVLVQDRRAQHFAAKIVKTRTQKKREAAVREYETMRHLRHNKLVTLVDAFVAKDAFVIVMDYLWGGELFDRIVDEENIKEIDVVPYVRQICEALQYLHQLKIAHLDLKPENVICLNPNSGQVKIIDFGLARVLEEGHVTRAIYGTRDYVAPEVLNFESLTLACDMWSLGVVTYMLLSGVMPFAGDTWPERSANITMANYNYDDTAFCEISDLAKDFVDQLLILAARKRMNATAALNHRWIVEGPPKGIKAGHMKRTRENLKSYLANYRARWQRAGNVIIASHRLRMHASALFGGAVAARSAAPCVT